MFENQERLSVDKRSALGAALSLEFECSFVAAEANEAAYQLLDDRHNLRAGLNNGDFYAPYCPPFQRVHVLEAESDSQNAEVIFLKSEPITSEQPVQLALTETVKTTQKHVVSRKLLKRHVKVEFEEEKDEPILAAVFGDIVLPLATFARRKDGVCSYVQIGSEIKNDNFHVLAADDLTSRNNVIEAIRAVLDSEYADLPSSGNSDALKVKRQQALQTFFNIEFKQNKENLAKAFEAQLVRKCTEGVRSDEWRRLAILNDHGETYDEKFNIKKVLASTRFDDDHQVTLVVGRPIEGVNRDISQLFAVTRGMLALPLAQFNATTGQLIFENKILATDLEMRKQLVYQLLSVLREGKEVEKNDARKNIFAKLGTMNRLANAIGMTTVEEEDLVQQLYDMKLKSTVHSGVIENVAINDNNTVADALFQVRIEREGTCFSVTVSGKPQAMSDEPLRVLQPFCFSFDTTRPINDQLNGTKDYLSELLETFDKLHPATSKTSTF